jgi:hypothetical protein
VRNPAFNQLIEEIKALHESKNHDYASDVDPLSNFRRAEKLGVTPLQGILVRMSDKWSRIEQLVSGKTPKNESLRDTLMDNAIYSLLGIIILDESNESKNEYVITDETLAALGMSRHGELR